MGDFETLQDEVLQKLPLLTVEQLEECCTQLAITVPTTKKRKRTAVRSLVLTHLTSEETEQDEDVVEVLTEMNCPWIRWWRGKWQPLLWPRQLLMLR